MEDGGTDLELSLEEVTIDMLVQPIHGEGVKVKEAEEGIEMKGILEKEDSEEMLIIITKGMATLDEVKVKEDPEDLERDKEMEAVEGM